MRRLKRKGTRSAQCGAAPAFTLVSVLLLISLAALLIVGLLAIVRTDSKRVAIDRDLVEARSNARFALATTLSELQRYAGPDQAVSARADIAGDDVANPHWVGIWHATEEARNRDSLGAFLVSGNERFDIDETTTDFPEGYQDPAYAIRYR